MLIENGTRRNLLFVGTGITISHVEGLSQASVERPSSIEAAARHLSFTKAANELPVTQAAVSCHILTLEDHLQVQLFNRGNQKVSLSAPGEELVEAVTLSLWHMAAAFDSVQGGRGPSP
ncbi:LysR family transcriptional regulator [Mesorhizobium sp. Cs1299R1N1]|uniref:LysR family transcriptional regulator n=1 Tax=Mesorhizobium sp. Cs1299R1N1 TaxID=3015172 RepID=UPI00301DE855